ncbi:diaminopimelate decarboxylase [Cryobacterium sp. TMT1-21]|uniref:Diaminopimelate decarboxylase n=1 Tax=Cryobacterium shii TaxID=1259235 RepID=A0AAQ2C4K3_9MICO|nr:MULTISPECIES: diaminopimelate decarboxylase [Cryobacterium]TFC42591.1 diaminopimelate decarboxylase [Cryobacterium shii]TFC80942.1 diaminopimelate decarboxylase [Cryobacterium sp. TmT2-59]TFD13276.1 diaminopimelate decarboxylase [Cryobacterium sp. TMT1-21]TFD18709.1 diaminopimelate decarboxylase [Cryobacterium sp. TMT4-10]TFD28445.1 diaminopimelate decarboxylase [Cryobacterium sp. TMT2-23]
MATNPLAPDWLGLPDDANALARGLWPATLLRAPEGELVIGGVPASALAAEFGTPLYVVDETDARARAATLREAFEAEFARIGTTVHIYYAGKAFLSTEVARWMLAEGLNIDICSGGELAVALAAGTPPHRLGFHGNNKSLTEIDDACRLGVGTIVIDSPVEISRVAEAAARHGARQTVRLRVNSGVHAHTHDFLATAHEDQKFGVALEDAPALVARIRAEPSLRFLGLHCHIGSQIFGADGFAESASRLLAVHADLLAGGPVPEMNLGGGFGIAYTSADTPTPIRELAARLADIVAAECAARGIPVPVVAFEPGRAIIGPAGVTLYEVGTTKAVNLGGNTRLYVSVDGGMSDNARPALYGADYTVRLANRSSQTDPVLVRVAGKHCESGDIVVDADYLPGDVAPGDLVMVAATGAYCWSLSNNYNFVGRPAVVAVAGGIPRMLVRGETVADLLARDTGFSPAADPADTRPKSPKSPKSPKEPAR